MSADPRQIAAQHERLKDDVFAENRRLRADNARLSRIVDDARAECRTLPSESWYGRAMAKALGVAP